jgi:hypothetical protein
MIWNKTMFENEEHKTILKPNLFQAFGIIRGFTFEKNSGIKSKVRNQRMITKTKKKQQKGKNEKDKTKTYHNPYRAYEKS